MERNQAADPRTRRWPNAGIHYPGDRAHWVDKFAPDYTPEQMARMGVFGDAYWGDKLGQERAKLLPSEMTWPKGDRLYTNTRGAQCKRINYHGRPASLTRDWWLDKGLIYDIDPLGWFEWYCHYSLGRRVDNGYDAWQVDRWVKFKARQMRMYWGRPVAGTAQALLHWGINADAG